MSYAADDGPPAVENDSDAEILEPEPPECTNYSDSFDVRVLDASLRPVQNASVVVTYDRGVTFGSQYFTTPPKYTDSNGKVHFDLINQGTNTRELDCSIVITASIAGGSNTTTVIATAHGKTVDVPITYVYPVRFYVRDETGNPLSNATVTLSGLGKTTGADGLAAFFIDAGEHNYLASYLDGGQPGHLNVSRDVTYEVIMRAYKVTVEIVDDFGRPLQSTLFIFNRTFQLEDGKFEYDRTFGSEIPYRADYKTIIKEGAVVPSVNPKARIIYDIHAPLFGKITPEREGGRYKLVIRLSDPGSNPSGVDFGSLKLAYRREPADPTTPWNPAVTYAGANETVVAEFPALPSGSIVSFMASVKDTAGNQASIEGTFSTPAAPVNNTQNQTIPQPNVEEEQKTRLAYVFVGVIAAILIVYVVFHIKSQGGG
jgi:hypothetical protein